MKSPFLIFLPAAFGAAGIYLMVQPGQREELPVEASPPEVRYSGGNSWGEREWGGTRPPGEPRSDETVNGIPDHRHSDITPRSGSARRNLRSKEMALPDPPGAMVENPPFPGSSRKSKHTRSELERRAAQVEIEANRELERLIPVLGLSEAQQQRIFAVLVRHSAGFDPVMRVETTGESALPEDATYAGATKDEELYAALDSDQQVVMEELYEDQAAWWQDVVEQLVPDSSIPGIGGYEPPILADDKPETGSGEGKDVTGSVRPPSP